MVLFAGLLFVACPAEAQEKRTIRLVSTSYSWTNDLAFRVGRARGFFKNQGIAIEPILIRGGPIALAALVTGEVDFATGIGVQAPIRAAARGLDIVIIGSVIDKATYGLVGNRETRTLGEVKGKIVGVTGAGAFSDFVIRTYLKRNGIDPDKDVTLRAVGSSSLRAVALERGLIAVAPFGGEEAVGLVKKGFPLIANLGESLAIPQSLLVTRRELLAKYAETTKNFLKGLITSLQFTRNNKDEALNAGYATGLTGEQETISKAYDLFIPAYSSDLSIPLEGLQEVLAEDIRTGVVDGKMTLNRVIDDRLLKQVQAEMRRDGRLK
jgi:ABC-type nitrate/sulfonate/bicarbonate transport system substrate-binding protein